VSDLTDAEFNRMVIQNQIAAIEMLEAMTQNGEAIPPKECGYSCDCNDCNVAYLCQEKWDYDYECDADCRYCNNDDCRDR